MELAFVVWVGLDLGRSARGQVLPQAADDSSTPWKGFGPMRFVPIIGCVAEATKESVLIAVLKCLCMECVVDPTVALQFATPVPITKSLNVDGVKVPSVYPNLTLATFTLIPLPQA